MTRKKVEAKSTDGSANTITRTRALVARAENYFAEIEGCKEDVPLVHTSSHNSYLDAGNKTKLAENVKEPVEAKKPAKRKESSLTEPKAKETKKEKKAKDPNAPKRPPNAFFLFMQEYKEENSVTKGAWKEAGGRWKSMTDEDKQPYRDKAAELRARYYRALEGNNAENEDDEGVSSDIEVGAEQEVQHG